MINMRTLRPAVWWLLAAAALVVCPAQSQLQLPTPLPADVQYDPTFSSVNESAAKVTSISGQVAVLRGQQPWALNVGDFIQQKQIVLSGPDGYAIFQVSDGSTFEVFPNSRVTFRNNPGAWSDLLDLWLGRVKVYIRRFGGQPNPARIYTPTAVISVRGTVFDVALEDEDTTYVGVEEGQVGVRHRLIPQDDQKLINPGESIRVYKNAPLAKARIDKGAVAHRAANALAEAFYTIMTRVPRGGAGGSPVPGGGGGGPLPGDTGAEPPPPPPPPPPGNGGAAAPPPPPGI